MVESSRVLRVIKENAPKSITSFLEFRLILLLGLLKILVVILILNAEIQVYVYLNILIMIPQNHNVKLNTVMKDLILSSCFIDFNCFTLGYGGCVNDGDCHFPSLCQTDKICRIPLGSLDRFNFFVIIFIL